MGLLWESTYSANLMRLIDRVIQHRVCGYKCLLEITEPSGATGQPGLAGVWELGMIIVGDEVRKVGSVQTLKA